MRYRIAKLFLISNAIVLLFLYILLHYLMKDSLRQRTPNMEILDVPFNHSFSMGTGNSQIELCEALRQTWIPLLIRDLPFTVEYSLLLDNPTPEILSEFTTKQDIVFLNSSYSGYVVRFSEKKCTNGFVIKQVAKMDDDVFLCVNKMIQRLSNLKHRRLYYGWQHNKEYMQIDEIERSQCNNKSELVDEGWGGKSIGLWLSVYDDVITVPDNQNIIYYNRVMKPPIDIRKEENFCQKYLLYHKASVSDMVFLHNMTTAGETNKCSNTYVIL
ncbi:hypothetical protein ACJMK2_008533 [Sinanodonta woodiana]|uniref:Hexosyltransferase n=1 Tax=Sinanodonta woodiana TaxID=1069815 RepID=A0ABD3VMQ1_SINWO